MSEKTQVWMYGGGTQSCAIAALIKKGDVPAPDWAVIADTGRERITTWQYLKDVIQPALPFKIHIVPKSEFATVDLWRNDDLLIPAFTNINGTPSKLPTFCSNEWKVRVCHRWLRKQGVEPNYAKWIGFSVDEAPRYMRMRASQPDTRFPLVERFIMKSGCRDLVQEMGWPPANGSHCWMCPNMDDSEWLELTPEELQQAIELDREIRKRDPHVFLHKSCIPLDQVKFSNKDERRACDSGVCFL